MKTPNRARSNARTLGASMPRHNRSSMQARPWRGFVQGVKGLMAGQSDAPVHSPGTDLPWEAAAKSRRRTLLLLTVLSTVFATLILTYAQPTYEHASLQWLQTGLFSLLFAWVSAGCITAVMGFWVVVRGDKYMLSKDQAGYAPIRAKSRTAIIMPICNEDVSTVFAGLRATCESLATHSERDKFDVFVLSDTSDPTIRAAELSAWAQLRSVLGSDRIFYRWRQRRTQRKAGNVSDFCRRWGKDYEYMVVLDADSVMGAECLVTLVRLMEKHPTAGILQTAPQAVGHVTLHARAQQFASRVTGRLFTLGMQYWQLGESHYWGHNAIIRVKPFMEHCALAALEGTGGLSGHIMSHDFVEAALMRRAGYHVWLVPDLVGSYEQQPPDILSELQRDRRWCQGNLQNARLMAEPGLHAVHRGMLLTGAMSYLSAPLWLLYVSLGAVLWLVGGNVLFTPEGHLNIGVPALWTGTITMLVLPRVLGLIAVFMKGEQRQYGGTDKLLKSALLEAGLSTLQAPLRMVGHTVFVTGALLGLQVGWKSPPRDATDVPWKEAAQRFAPAGVLVALVSGAIAVLNPEALFWMVPVGLPLMLAIPFIVLTSRANIGQKVRNARLLLVPEEYAAPAVLNQAWQYARQTAQQPTWRDLLADSRLCAVITAAMGNRRTSQGVRGEQRREWVKRLINGESSITPADRMRFLSEPSSLQQLRAGVVFPRQTSRA